MPVFDTVHAPLAHWAEATPRTVAIDDGVTRLDFAALAQQVAARAAALRQSHPSAVCWVDDVPDAAAQLLDFLAILAAGRTAAVSDPDWPPAVREQILARVAAGVGAETALAKTTSSSPFYIGFTSGSSGLPKGFRRSHGSWTSSFDICLESFGAGAAATMLVPGRLSHSTFLFGALLGLWSGAGVRLQSRFAPGPALDTLACSGDQGAGAMVAVPSQLILMLELAQRRKLPAMPGVQLLMIGGAPWNRARTPELRQLFPQARIIEFYGASETSFIAWTDSDASLPDHVVGRPFSNVEVRIDATAPDIPGLIYVRSPMVFTDYVTLRDSDEQPALLRDGDWLSVRDVGHLDERGRLHLLGRQQRMLLAQGKNLFPEEVESVLTTHPAVAAASVQGIADAVRGVQIAALLKVTDPVSPEALVAWCRERLEPYKIPRRFYTCNDWPLTPSGKTDHKQLAQRLDDPAMPTLTTR
ncbi:o-succinylbenzoate--CoA ligase [Herbaspirillum lusitanum]|uniref:AMP-binding protein n=1 Tax=Herbaspirillum lusitanum TaxID=213312 RepID=UPI002238D1B4|nr:AMP-binding protein [Herbaspirillum lusitanum]MCW5300013.1 o-succinylbenzoate--CoA ligase [Herbaspirillum lusitanum]